MTDHAGERIVSFLPAATEMVCALGAADRLVGVSHECDYPPEVARLPRVVRPALPLERMALAEIDAAVGARLRAGASLYEVDERLLRELRPDLLLTQDLCQVCAPSGNEVTRVLAALPRPPRILWLSPSSLAGIRQNLRDVGDAVGAPAAAERLIADSDRRIAAVRGRLGDVVTRRVFCTEWVDPLFCGGHWIPEMVALAGGTDALGRPGADSARVDWADVVHWAPEVLVVMPCGYRLQAAVEQARRLAALPGWEELPAVGAGRVYAVDANAYFARPGPRFVEGIELLAHLIHPERVAWSGPDNVWAPVT